MAQGKNDQVFAVSLSEIAFTLLFLLMLLLGFMVLQERQKKDAAQEQLTAIHQAQAAEVATAAMREAQARLEQTAGQLGVPDPKKLVEALTENGEVTAQRDRLQQEVQDLTKRLVALEELRSQIQEVGQRAGQAFVQAQTERALALQRELKKLLKDKLNRELRPGEESQALNEIVESAVRSLPANGASQGDLKAENDRLRTQLTFYVNRDKLRGLDHPPCWMDAQSKQEFIFTIQTTANGIVVTRGWPDHRGNDARASAGFEAMTANGGAPMTAAQFSQAAAPFLAYGKKQSPECRHFVYLSSSISDADRRDEARRLVNSFFYILERKGF